MKYKAMAYDFHLGDTLCRIFITFPKAVPAVPEDDLPRVS